MSLSYVDDAINDLNKILKTDDVRILIQRSMGPQNLGENNIHYIEYESAAQFSVLSGAKSIASFVLCQFPGCCGICLSTRESVHPDFRNRGVGSRLSLLRKQMAKDRGYTVLLCTDVANNFAQKKVLNRNNWIDLFRFRNRRTRNLVDISVVLLDPSCEGNSLITHTSQGEKESCPTLSRPLLKSVNFSRITSWFSSLFTGR